MTAEMLRRCGEGLYGERWQSDAAFFMPALALAR